MCEPGYSLPLCTPCAPGFFAALANATQCQPCPQHTFSALYAAVTCLRCPYTTYTPTVGSSVCLACSQANSSFLEADPAACAVSNPAYNNIVAMGIGMVMFIAMLVVLCRYYALRQKVKHLYFCETLRKRDQQRYRQIHLQQEDTNDADLMLRVAQDVEDNQSDDAHDVVMADEAAAKSVLATATTATAATPKTALTMMMRSTSPATHSGDLPRHSAVHAP
jgi:hypothetical protein